MRRGRDTFDPNPRSTRRLSGEGGDRVLSYENGGSEKLLLYCE